jgi:YD repeat-containing protein
MDHPFYNASDFGGSKIVYPFSTKYEVGGNFANGKTTYEYDFELDDIIESSYPDPMSLVDLSWKSGHLISEKNFKLLANDEYQCVKEKLFTYTSFYTDTTFGLKVGKKKIYTIQILPSINTFPHCGEDFNKDYYYFEYPLYSAAKKLTKSIEKDYSENINGQPVVAETNYFYDNLQTLLQTRTESVNSAGETIKNIYKYPHDFVSQSPYAEMVNDRHIWSPVIEQLTYKENNVFLKSAKTNYDFWNNGVWGTNASPSLIVPQSVDLKNLNYTLETRLNLNSYDANGNLLEQQKTNDIKEVYLWGYEGQYPVAKILNSTYSIASGYITQSVLDNPSDDATLRSHLANLRNIPGTMVTTYTYKPLVGMTSQTDPAGRTIYYEYDSFNRLKTIRDQDGKVIKTIDYQYQQTNNH